MDLREIGWEDVDFISLAQDKEKQWDVENMVINFRVSYTVSYASCCLLSLERTLSSLTPWWL
jgi:hypothetical protein